MCDKLRTQIAHWLFCLLTLLFVWGIGMEMQMIYIPKAKSNAHLVR